MIIAGKTDVGKQREMNQDFIKFHKFDEETALLIVCDGMGGARAGNVASEVAANSIYDFLIKKYDNSLTDHAIKTIMTSAVNCANLDVFDLAQNNAEYYGMGTTVVAVLIKDGYAYTIHAGDSRAYIIYPEGMKKITTDHSIVQQLIESQMITEEEAKHHPKRNVITRALGVEECLESDFSITRLESDYTILICSDGLTNYADEEEIFEISKKYEPEEICEKLIKKANNNGGGDNISLVVAKDK